MNTSAKRLPKGNLGSNRVNIIEMTATNAPYFIWRSFFTGVVMGSGNITKLKNKNPGLRTVENMFIML
jgi:hypothetical protein